MSDLSEFEGKALVCTSPELQVSNEMWQSLNTVITVKADQFHEIGSGSMKQWYPKKELTNIIGSGMGIEFDSHVEMKEVYSEERILPDGTRIRKVAGYQCTKVGKKRKPDGDFMYSSPGVYEFNWEDRAEEDFLKDMDNIGQFWPDKNPKAKYNFPDDPAKQAVMRRKHVLELKKFAAQRASTGAELLVIRELTGMPTGFKPGSIPGNQIVVSQICKSTEKQHRESEAHIRAILNGSDTAKRIDNNASLLTGKTTDSRQDIEKNTAPKSEEKIEQKPETTPKPKPKTVMDHFSDLDNGIVPVFEAYALIIDHPELSSFPGLDQAKKLVTDNGSTDDVKKYVLDEIKGGLK